MLENRSERLGEAVEGSSRVEVEEAALRLDERRGVGFSLSGEDLEELAEERVDRGVAC